MLTKRCREFERVKINTFFTNICSDSDEIAFISDNIKKFIMMKKTGNA